MTEYLVYHGGYMASSDDPGLVSFKSNKNTILVRGDLETANRWADILRTSVVIRETMKNGNVSLQSFSLANKYCAWTLFTDKEFDEFGDVYNKVKGTTIVVKIKPEKDEKK